MNMLGTVSMNMLGSAIRNMYILFTVNVGECYSLSVVFVFSSRGDKAVDDMTTFKPFPVCPGVNTSFMSRRGQSWP